METSQDVYEDLAAHLDRLPAGFPRTPSGVEMRILKRLFTPEEALLAQSMTFKPETAQQVADRAGLDKATLNIEPSKKGGFLARIEGRNLRGPVAEERLFKTQDELKEGLKPFIEEQGLPTKDLFESLRGIYSESEVRLAADYPFKKDWWKVQVKDWLKIAAEDPTAKVLGLPSGEMMAERLGFGLKAGPTGEYVPASPRGEFAWKLYEKKVPKWIEEEFGIKLEKGATETMIPGGSRSKAAGETEEVPVWIVPLEPIREKLKKPLRLSFLTESAKELA